MIEIRFHGRGGQGAVTAAKLLAMAIAKEEKYVLAFPYYGVERRGAPVTAYVRMDEKPVRERSMIKTPDIVVVIDETLVSYPKLVKEGIQTGPKVNVVEGLKEGGWLIINTRRSPEEVKDLMENPNYKIATVDATSISIKYGLGPKMEPIPNTPMLGALVKATNLVRLESVIDSVKESPPGDPERNISAIKDAYENTKVGGSE